MKEISECILCGSKENYTYIQGEDKLHGVSGNFEIVKCNTCGLYYLHMRPDENEIEKYYPENYISFPVKYKNTFMKIDKGYAILKRCRQVMRKAPNPGRILDIGCATGLFLDGMRNYGWDVYGVEPSKYAANYAHTELNLNVLNGTLDDSKFPNDYFDVITMWDVLEHLPNPLVELNEINRILKPGGWLIIGIPNADSWETAWFGSNWAGWDIPRHFFIYTPSTIRLLLEKTRFSLKEIISFTGRHGVLVLSVSFWLKGKMWPERIKKSILAVLSSIPLRVLTYPYYMVADRINKSSIMTVFSQKK